MRCLTDYRKYGGKKKKIWGTDFLVGSVIGSTIP